jgi:DNA-binding MarR family transcriptional regulator
MENRVRFKIGEIEFEAEGSEDVIERERSVFLNSLLPAAVDAIVKTRGSSKEGLQYLQNAYEETPLIEYNENDTEIVETIQEQDIDFTRTNLVTFLKKYGTLSDKDFVLLSAYYDERKENMKEFSSENVKKYYADARRTEYSNISQLLSDLVRKGMIMDAPGVEQKSPKLYILTSEGLEYVEKYKPNTEPSEKKKLSKPRKKKSKIDSIYASLCVDDINLKNYPEIKSYDAFKDQMLLIMYIIVNESKGVSFSAQDIECIMTDILGLPATINQINGIFTRNKTWFKDEEDPNNLKAVKHKLLQGGKDYAMGLIQGKDA